MKFYNLKNLSGLFLSFVLLPLFSSAQTNYLPGYVVTLNGDTLKGFIDIQNWDFNPEKVSFKPTINAADSKSFSVNDINFFSVGKLVSYERYDGPVSLDVTNISHLATSRSTKFKTATVFLKILQKGKNVALFSFTDDIKTRFYIGEAPEYKPIELEFRIYDDPGAAAGTHAGTVTENTYLKQLFAFANKYKALDDDLTWRFQTAGYAEPDLLLIVSRINGITKTEFERKYAGKSKLEFFAGAALNIANTSPSKYADYATSGGTGNSSFLPAVLVGANLQPNPNSAKLQLRAVLSLAPASFKSIYDLQDTRINVKASFDQFQVAVIPQVIYNFYTTENLKFYLGLGFALNYFTYSNVYFGNSNPAISNAGFASNPYVFEKFDNCFQLNAGIHFHKNLEIFINYSSNDATRGDYFDLTNKRTQFGLNYFFSK